jgi:hypothetical protein
MTEAIDVAQLLKSATVTPDVSPPIPPHIAGNLLEFLRRVQSTGMEAVAWVEAYQFVQKHAPQQQANNLPPQPQPPK